MQGLTFRRGEPPTNPFTSPPVPMCGCKPFAIIRFFVSFFQQKSIKENKVDVKKKE